MKEIKSINQNHLKTVEQELPQGFNAVYVGGTLYINAALPPAEKQRRIEWFAQYCQDNYPISTVLDADAGR